MSRSYEDYLARRSASSGSGRSTQIPPARPVIFRTDRSQPTGDSDHIGGSPSSATHSQPSIGVQEIGVEDILAQPGRDVLPRLHPSMAGGTTWFGLTANGISKAILKMMQQMLKDPYPTYTAMPQSDRDTWFAQFSQVFTWDPAHTALVRDAFDKEAAVQYSRTLNEWKSRWLAGKPVKKVSPELLDRFGADHWQLPATMAVSSTNSKNRLSDRGGKGIATHNLGAMSSLTRAQQIAARDGEYPDYMTVLEDMHTNRKTKEIQDPVAFDVLQAAKKKKEEYLSQQSQEGSSSSNDLPVEMINKFILEETPRRKGRTFGLGNLTQTSVPSAPYRDPEMERMQQALKEKDDRISTLEESVATMNAGLEERIEARIEERMERYMREMQARFNFPPN